MTHQEILRFGTDGWRATWPDVFTLDNVRRVAAAVCAVVRRHPWFAAPPHPALVIGYDTRHLSAEAARAAAEVAAAQGFRVLLADGAAATPAVALAITAAGAAAGLMITASHNPPRYNGLKVFDQQGASAPHAVCREIENVLDAGLPAERGAGGTIETLDVTTPYLAHLNTLVDRLRIAARPGRVLVDAMHGAGSGLVARWLAGAGWQVDEIRGTPDPEFGGGRPEPIMPHLQPLVAGVLAGRYDLGVAHDGDADRVGAVDERGQFVSPQVIFPLVLRYLLERRGWRGRVAKTVSTTALIDRLCERYELGLVETPVGFQDIAGVLLAADGLMGGEESGGMSVHGHVPQGDGVLMSLLLVEAVADAGHSLGRLVDDLMRVLGPVFYRREDIHLAGPLDKRSVVARLTGAAPERIAGLKVRGIHSNDGVKYLLEDGSWLLIRPSGTEPVLRVYAEAHDPGVAADLCAAGAQLPEEH
jgi:phosphomannomutase